MDTSKIMRSLKGKRNVRAMKSWKSIAGDAPFDSYCIGPLDLKKIASKIEPNHELSLALWAEPLFDAKTLATYIEEGDKVTREQIENQISEPGFWLLAHSYCNNLLKKVPFKQELMEEWLMEEEPTKRRCGFMLLYDLAKTDPNLEDFYFEPYLDMIEAELQMEDNHVKDAMNNALSMIGQRNKNLNERALSVARNIGKVYVTYNGQPCEAMDCVKHLTSPIVQSMIV